MFTTLVRLFGAGQQHPARSAGAPRVSLRLENLEGRAAPGALAFDHIGEEIPQTGVGIQADTTMIQPGHGGEVYTGMGIQLDATSVPVGHGGEVYTGVGGVDLNASKPTSGGDISFGVGIDPSASKPSSGGNINV
jgi:hypothetical protein